jgi:hypothetical protein
VGAGNFSRAISYQVSMLFETVVTADWSRHHRVTGQAVSARELRHDLVFARARVKLN